MDLTRLFHATCWSSVLGGKLRNNKDQKEHQQQQHCYDSNTNSGENATICCEYSETNSGQLIQKISEQIKQISQIILRLEEERDNNKFDLKSAVNLSNRSTPFFQLISGIEEDVQILDQNGLEQNATHFYTILKSFKEKFQSIFDVYSKNRQAFIKTLITKAKHNHVSKMVNNDVFDAKKEPEMMRETLQTQNYVNDKYLKREEEIMIQEKALEIAEIQRKFAFHVEQQAEMVERINDHITHAHEDIDIGNQHLVNHTHNQRIAHKWQTYIIAVMIVILLLLHITS
ncbi:MAG: hypothetical protein MHMPM18_000150 [Marteilia pararefringens]